MTEEEWLQGKDVVLMLMHLGGKTSDRKFRLFAAACRRRIWPLLAHDTHRRAVERAEQYADGLIPLGKMESAWRSAARYRDPRRAEYDQMPVSPRNVVWCVTHADGYSAASDAESDLFWSLHFWGYEVGFREEDHSKECAAMIRDIFGNPFRPEPVDPAWRTPTVVRLAQAAYDERLLPYGDLDTARLAVLADALEEAGCGNQAILGHLRQGDGHVRGCWAVDAVLAKE